MAEGRVPERRARPDPAAFAPFVERGDAEQARAAVDGGLEHRIASQSRPPSRSRVVCAFQRRRRMCRQPGPTEGTKILPWASARTCIDFQCSGVEPWTKPRTAKQPWKPSKPDCRKNAPRRRPPTAPARRRHGHYAGGLCPAPVGTPMPASTTIRMCAAITAGLALPYSPGRGWKLTAMAPSPSPGSVPGDGRRSFGGRMAGGQCCGAPSCGTSPYRLQWNAMARGFYSAASALHAPAHGSAALAAAPLMRAGRRVSPSRSCGSDAPRC